MSILLEVEADPLIRVSKRQNKSKSSTAPKYSSEVEDTPFFSVDNKVQGMVVLFSSIGSSESIYVFANDDVSIEQKRHWEGMDDIELFELESSELFEMLKLQLFELESSELFEMLKLQLKRMDGGE